MPDPRKSIMILELIFTILIALFAMLWDKVWKDS